MIPEWIDKIVTKSGTGDVQPSDILKLVEEIERLRFLVDEEDKVIEDLREEVEEVMEDGGIHYKDAVDRIKELEPFEKNPLGFKGGYRGLFSECLNLVRDL
jgi:hypothetical protein